MGSLTDTGKGLTMVLERPNIISVDDSLITNGPKFINHRHLGIYLYPAHDCRETFLTILSERELR